MKTSFNHLVNNRILTTLGAVDQELKIQSGKNYLFDLSYLGLVDVLGEKAPGLSSRAINL